MKFAKVLHKLQIESELTRSFNWSNLYICAVNSHFENVSELYTAGLAK